MQSKWIEMSYNLYSTKSTRYRLIYENDRDIEWLDEYKFEQYNDESEED